ncbi:MAG: 3-oxoacyl-ACP synthase [Ignavibacteria bacterium GWA2_55_11]|nr:MAG: 3-oxoacyl-ACP synthase [Ignavibacteria bacterium GWA2_55_11]OGU46364.1 MAG: 3-oxoacyl-ACP synthase [Ignavibacteria bacterium GWC2_56_12]OGU70867.1 MAG: 3-oxoacyl-ACP synthase [Ignavibacteria bacterium RIFCSPLOWO2_12_FULL_56_21]OGU73319.1 MAG: 3-oxoacyl-ACP synthase [Ignavibacteria bacterium RIFCSPLOWO2_02_FULL_55_14]HAV24499.1 3-oxoacyl-ACP synthase [Bacteroidota bacterium]
MADTHTLRRAEITAVGHYVPEKVLTNHDLEKMVDTNDEWIRSRTGISERRIQEHGASSDMAVMAIRNLVDRFGVDLKSIDLIIVATVTPDMFFPATACIIQEKIGAKQAWGFDILAACSGFLYALTTGAKFIESGAHSKVLVVGVDKMSSIVDYKDRNTCILFGDAAGVVLLEPSTDKGYGLIDQRLYCDGAGADFLYMKGGGSLNPSSHETVDKKMHYIFQDGKNVFKLAVKGMADVAAEVMNRNNLTGADIAWLVPHQANLRIIDATAERMGIDRSKVMINIDKYGNTTAATIPLCLSEWVRDGRLTRGHNIVLAAFGAGYTWGAAYVKWSIPGSA